MVEMQIEEEELGEEMAAPQPRKDLETDFGKVQMEGESKLEIIKNMEDKINEIIIQLKHYEDLKARQPGVYELLSNPKIDERTVAIDMYNLWRESNGLLIEIRSDARSLQKDLKTLDREIRRELATKK